MVSAAQFHMIRIVLQAVLLHANLYNIYRIVENSGQGNCGPEAIGQSVGQSIAQIRKVVADATALRAATKADVRKKIPTIQDKSSYSYVLKDPKLRFMLDYITMGLQQLPESVSQPAASNQFRTHQVIVRANVHDDFDVETCMVCRLAAHAVAVRRDDGAVYWFGDLELSIYSQATRTVIQIVHTDGTLGTCFTPSRQRSRPPLHYAVLRFSGAVERGHYEQIALEGQAVTKEIVKIINRHADNLQSAAREQATSVRNVTQLIDDLGMRENSNQDVQVWLADAKLAIEDAEKAIGKLDAAYAGVIPEFHNCKRLDLVNDILKTVSISVKNLNTCVPRLRLRMSTHIFFPIALCNLQEVYSPGHAQDLCAAHDVWKH
jgi:hypothetical protein